MMILAKQTEDYRRRAYLSGLLQASRHLALIVAHSVERILVNIADVERHDEEGTSSIDVG